jgi:ABC-type nickel/cobalt efflux system permease component RcnA
MRRSKRQKRVLVLISLLAVLLLVLFGGYACWNYARPERTCASCHEIVPSLKIWQQSAHREVRCVDCHGSAMGNGLHSLKEKSGMFFSHFREDVRSHKVGLNEAETLEVMQACIKCHRDEYTSWQAGGHSATYADIFLNEKHNSMERPYPDCFRCHGMYYDGTIADLVEPISTTGPWLLKQPEKASQPVIPCLACHPIHMENETMAHPGSMDDPSSIFYEREERNALTGLYLRSDRMHLRAEDDRTPTGVHEGLSCRACHRGHSNDPRNACKTCHPAVTSCGRDVMTMNTTYFKSDSPNNIHSMECTDCHDPVPGM